MDKWLDRVSGSQPPAKFEPMLPARLGDNLATVPQAHRLKKNTVYEKP